MEMMCTHWQHSTELMSTVLDSRGYLGQPIGGFVMNLFAYIYVQEVSPVLEGTTQKTKLWYKFHIKNYRENTQVERESIKM